MGKIPAPKLYEMTLQLTPYSSVVGQSLMIKHPDFGVVAQISIRVPQPNIQYEAVAKAVADALMRGHVSKDGVCLVLPRDFASALTGDTNGK